MTLYRHQRNRPGFTLIELLCVLCIIGVLMSLLLGPLGRIMKRAMAMQWAQESQVQLDRTLQQLQAQLLNKTNFPTVTLARLETNGWVGPQQLQFLKDRRVTFKPFAGSDADDEVVIQVKIDASFLNDAEVLTVAKKRITKPPE